MIIPISDYPNARGLPWMTLALIAANVAVFVLVTLRLSGRVGAEGADGGTADAQPVCMTQRISVRTASAAEKGFTQPPPPRC
jgi:hypothetical protein